MLQGGFGGRILGAILRRGLPLGARTVGAKYAAFGAAATARTSSLRPQPPLTPIYIT